MGRTSLQTADTAPLVERLRFRQAPLAAAAVWFAVGIGWARLESVRWTMTPAVLVLGALGVLGGLAAWAIRLDLRRAWVPVAGVWMVLGLAAGEWQPAPELPLRMLGFADNLSREVKGTVIRVRTAEPEAESVAAQADADAVPPWESAEEAAPASGSSGLVDLAVDAMEEVTPDASRMVPVTGGIRVAVYGAGPELHCGDQVELPLRLKPMERYRDPGAFAYGDYLLAQGIALEGGVDGSRIRVSGRSAPTLHCRIAALQGWASARLRSFVGSAANRRLPRVLRLDGVDARMLGAMLFGDRTGLTQGLRVGFERTGTFHLFVVSGLHVALLAAGVYWVLRRLRLPPWAATLTTMAVTAGYAALSGFGQPAQRALVMTCVYLAARLLGRTRDPLNALGAAVLALLVWAPGSLFDASLQMTALVIVAIAGIAVPMGEWTFLRYLPATRRAFRPYAAAAARDAREAQLTLMLELWGEAAAGVLGRWALRLPARVAWAALWAGELALVSVVTELVMVLPMAVYFHRATVFGVPANLLVLPVVGVLAISAVATFAVSLVSPWLALAPGAVTAALLHGVAWVIGQLSHLTAADLRVPGPVWWVAGLALAVWAGCCWAVRRSGRWACAAAVALPLIAAAVLWPEPMVRSPGVLEVTALDVGQGDSLLVVGPMGRTMLIDAGGPVGRHGTAEVVSGFDAGEEVVAPYLWSRRVRRLDVVVLTHAHTDHMGGMPAILNDFRPRELWVGADARSTLYTALLEQAARLGIVVRHLRAGDRPAWGEVQVEALAPQAGYRNPGAPKNDDSLVLRLEFGRASALLEGDAERPSEQAMLAAGLVQPVTLLKVGHHGSRTSTTQAFLDAAAPVDAVVSVGQRNTFGHPRGEVIARLAAERAHLFRTDEFGLTTFLLGADGGIREVVDGVMLPRRAVAVRQEGTAMAASGYAGR